MKAKSSYGENKPVIISYDVPLNRGPFLELKKQVENWKVSDYYSNPGPTQFFGERAPGATLTLKYDYENYLGLIKRIEELTEKINESSRFGTEEDLLRIAIGHLENLVFSLNLIKSKFHH